MPPPESKLPPVALLLAMVQEFKAKSVTL